MQMISASFLACFPQALPKVPVKNPHPFVMGIECFSPFSATHPTPSSSPGVESDFSLQNSLRLSVTPRREQANAERGLEMFLLPRGCPLEVEASRQGWQLHRTDSAATRKAASVVPGPRCQPLPVERRYLGCSRENLEVKMDDCDADLV